MRLAGCGLAVLVLAGIGWGIWSAVAPDDRPSGMVLVRSSSVPSDGTPLSILQKHDLPELQEWATRWQSSQNTPAYEQGLLRILVEESNLSAMDMLTISKSVMDAGDVPTAITWVRSGVARFHGEIAKARESGAGELEVQDRIRGALPAFDAANMPLWGAGDGQTQLLMTELQMMLPRDGAADQRPEWARIGYGEALVLLNRNDEALAHAESLWRDVTQNPHWTAQQESTVHWMQAMAYSRSQRYEEAMPHLRAAATDPGFHHRSDAAAMMVFALLYQDRVKEAGAVLNGELAEVIAASDSGAQAKRFYEARLAMQ
jgi:hypothetical protein